MKGESDMQRIETPERFMKGATCEDRLLDQIEGRISFLTAELEEVNKKLQHERWFFRKRQLEDQKQKLEYELRWARYQEQHLKKSTFRIEAREA